MHCSLFGALFVSRLLVSHLFLCFLLYLTQYFVIIFCFYTILLCYGFFLFVFLVHLFFLTAAFSICLWRLVGGFYNDSFCISPNNSLLEVNKNISIVLFWIDMPKFTQIHIQKPPNMVCKCLYIDNLLKYHLNSSRFSYFYQFLLRLLFWCTTRPGVLCFFLLILYFYYV